MSQASDVWELLHLAFDEFDQPTNSGSASARRALARGNGHDLSDRGRIPTHVVEEFEKAHR